jgi:two-component system, response regulator
MNEYSSVEILLVEDNAHDAELAFRAFRKNHITNRIIHVRDGEEALEFLFARGRYRTRRVEDTPKVILLDLKLPKINGLEVLREIRKDRRTRLIPVVVLTTSKEEKDLITSYRLGVNSYIIKPVDFNQFIRSVNDIGLYWLLLNQLPEGVSLKENGTCRFEY